ncbi:MAG TPA: carboxypeptidase regulatory-like domain-containing protein [Pyrinomonadaceae bacterium]|nr:carboxypeptidase regulatory-like domain-containing protein [Pyrinomonadaceae bacterium]
MTKKISIKFLAMTIFCMLLSTASVLAQSTVTGAINGKVTDPQGAVVPNATVTVTDIGTNNVTTVTTASDGGFRVSNLRPATYLVETTVTGFAPFRQEKVVVEVGRVTTVDIPLTIGEATATVEVTAEAPVINTTQQDFSNNIDQTSINELPINGRRASNFVLLTPGVAPDGAFGLISFRGISGLLNNSTVDGGDNNQAFFSEERGRTRISYSISQDAVREFQVNTSNYSAEFGRAAGGVVNTVTKSGTNEFHGSAFYYLRDNRFGARNAFSTQTITTASGPQIVGLKPEDVRHQFGGSLGGPIVKDRLFFFFSYDQQKRNFPGVSAPSSLTFYNLTAAQTATLTSRGVTPAQISAGISFLQSLNGEVPRKADQLLLLPKIDWVINDKHTFSAVYNRLRADSPAGVQSQAVVTRGIASFGDDKVSIDTLNLRLNSTLTPSILNEARFQWSRDLEQQVAQPPAPNEPTTANGFSPSVAIGGGGFTFGKPNFLDRAAYPDEKRWQYANTTTVIRGRHTLKFGGDFNYVSDLLDNLFQNAGAYSYSNIEAFLSDYAFPATGGCFVGTTTVRTKCYTSFNQGFGPTAFKFATKDYNLFFQDDFRITPQLTLNFGLRYELQTLPEPQIPNSLEPRTANFPTDKNNFGPRIGFALDATGDGKTSIRGGYGIYYGRIINSTISNAITNTAATGSQVQFSLQPASPGSPTYPNVLAAAPNVTGARPDIVVFKQNMQNPLIHQMDVIFERVIAKNTVVSVSGLLSIGRYLPTFVDTNLPFPTGTSTYTFFGGPFDGQQLTLPRFTGARPNANFGRITEIRDTISSEYYGLVLQANRRLTRGLQFQTSYTYSMARDNGQTSQTFTNPNVPLNPFDLDLEYGTSNLDIPHRFVASAVYAPGTLFGVGRNSSLGRAIFGGFTIAPIVTIQSGRPYSAGVSGNAPTPNISTGILGAGGDNRLPTIERNAYRLPYAFNVDLRISRRFRLTETANLEVLAEGFNIFNRQNITNVGTTAYTISTVSGVTRLTYNTATFGVPSEAGNTIFRERQIQFAARFQF